MKKQKKKNRGNVVRIDIPDGLSSVNVDNGMIYVKVYAAGDTPMDGPVLALSHTSPNPPNDLHDDANSTALTRIAGTNDWKGCISAPLDEFYVSACAKFENEDDPMDPHHVPDTTVELTGVEGEEPNCNRKAKKPKKRAATKPATKVPRAKVAKATRRKAKPKSKK